MALTVDPNSRMPAHIDPVVYIHRVPSRREAEAAYTKIIAALPQDIAEQLEPEILTARDFLCSR